MRLLSATLSLLAVTASAAEPYVIPTAPGVTVNPIATVGDSFNSKPDGTPYLFVGIPDGLGLYRDDDGHAILLMNHELREDAGVVRAHGQRGAFVSRWTLDGMDVEQIEDFDPAPGAIHRWDATTATYVADPSIVYRRLCSADLALPTAYFNPFGHTGTTTRIFLNGEETGAEGRAFAHVATGKEARTSFELPHLGKASWENLVACPFPQERTVVIGLEDGTPGQVYVYVGRKERKGSDVERAGLVGGSLYGIAVEGAVLEDRTTAVGSPRNVPHPFHLASLGDVSTKTGAEIQTASTAAGITEFLRPEDGAWDPLFPRDFYFVTTDQFDDAKNGGSGATTPKTGHSRLWRLRFADIRKPELGGSITMLIDGSENPGPQMMDNLCVDGKGRILIQEDPGNQLASARIWMYEIASGDLTEVARHNPALFGDRVSGITVPAVTPLTTDEESSGIIDAGLLGSDVFLFTTQAHYAIPGELVEGGQLQAMTVKRGGSSPWRRLLTAIFPWIEERMPHGIAAVETPVPMVTASR